MEEYKWHGRLSDVIHLMREVPDEEFKQAMIDIVGWFSVDIAGVTVWRIGPDEYVITGPYKRP